MISSDAAPALPQLPVAESHRLHAALLADDLTGACDASVAFLASGHSVRVWLGAQALHTTPESVQAFNTDSRTLAPKVAAAAVTLAASRLGSNALFFKKIDSAVRGPLAAELLAAHRALGTQAMVFTPSFPAAGRTVREGMLRIEDASGEPLEIALEQLFPEAIQPLIALIRHPNELAEAFDAGKTILLCDAATQADLEALVQAAILLPRLLYAGSAGLAQALASLNRIASIPDDFPSSERSLVVVGTRHPVTNLQLAHLAENHPNARVLRIGWKPDDDRLIREEFRQFAPQALICSGGDTALLVARALDAHSFVLHGEFAAGIPWGIMDGGKAQGCVIVTKSGGFGAADALSKILNVLSGRA